MARIAILEDDAAIRDALAELLSRQGHEPVPVTDFMRAVPALLKAEPDLVLLDLGLPGVDGTAVCRGFRAQSNAPIVVVTSRDDELDEVLCMRLGADDYVTKPYSPHVLLARIEAVLRRTGSGAVPLLRHKGVTLDIEAATVSTDQGSVELTRNELKILALLMRNAGSVVSRSALMCELWDSDAFIDDNTLTVNINRLRQTLERVGARDLLVTHRGRGYSV